MFNPIIDFTPYLAPGEQISFVYNIPGYVEVLPYYYVTSKGRVFSLSYWHGIQVRELSPVFTKDKDPYLEIQLQMPNNDRQNLRINRLVLYYFGGPIPPDAYRLEANHLDKNHLNNDISNLRWDTHIGNMNHHAQTGNGSLTDETVKNIFKDLNSGKYTNEEIAQRNGTNASIINHIKRRETYTYLDPGNVNWTYRTNLTRTDYVNIYKAARDGISDRELAVRYNCSEETIAAIRRVQYPYDAILGDYPPILRQVPKCDDEKALAIYNDCKENKLSQSQIAAKYGVGKSLVADVKFLRGSYEPLREKYKIEPLTVDPKGTGIPMTKEIRNAIIEDLKLGMKPKEIANKYGYSESIVYRVRRTCM